MKSPRRIEYAEYLQSAHWHALRAKVLARDAFQCVRCVKLQSFLLTLSPDSVSMGLSAGINH
jgi:hypothetical protein